MQTVKQVIILGVAAVWGSSRYFENVGALSFSDALIADEEWVWADWMRKKDTEKDLGRAQYLTLFLHCSAQLLNTQQNQNVDKAMHQCWLNML